MTTTVDTVRLSGGSLGSETMLVRCDLTQASAPVQVDYCTGDGWESTQWQCADCRHTLVGLIEIAMRLAAQAVEVSRADFTCNVEQVD